MKMKRDFLLITCHLITVPKTATRSYCIAPMARNQEKEIDSRKKKREKMYENKWTDLVKFALEYVGCDNFLLEKPIDERNVILILKNYC